VANWNQEGLGYLRASAEIAAQLGDEAAGKVADHFVACEVGRDRFGGNPRQRIGFPGSVGKGFPGWCLGNWRVKNGGAIFEIKAPHQFKVVDGETSTGGGLQGVRKLFECLFSISSPIRTLLFELDDIEAKKEVSSHEMGVYAAVGRKQELLVGLPAKVNELVEVHVI
jgi:hypothetical protein